MNFQEFKEHANYLVNIVKKDLAKLEGIAKEVNNQSSSTTLQTTLSPEDWKRYCERTSRKKEDTDESRCTIPMAMLCFAIVDMVGQWLKGVADDEFTVSAQRFFKDLANKSDLDKQESREKIKRFFRHGIVHSFFPKNGYDITYPAFEGRALFIDIQEAGKTLDVRYLASIVKEGMDTLIDVLENEESEMSQTLFTGYRAWAKE
ncbi:MAG: hypothetical protein ACO1NW_11815 [Chitinophagaceae bacterium]